MTSATPRTTRTHAGEPGTPGALAPRPLAVAILLVGPLATVAWVAARLGASWLPAEYRTQALCVALAAWSPLPVSLPAILLQDARDAALPGYRGPAALVRGVRLVPHLLFSPASAVRAEMAASLAGFAAALYAARLT